ncbi:dehydrodolichyl diphosphate synthase complex subunit nus1 [Leptopilina heterotoma]|uniref:dehydrodolichyl diphosphate synthase complex subunit nus1 n=1 Tax=Leptopilina heterotoma TaxID=63436 RepID=UPI001CA9762B|nr:dehydrodolichyl diphosphate synthase complex subunit nus1 [Leptopilina heterotoma]XP_043480900.1 dehydrodolichyl diphosphate synthase complex subunit nus1 [Leptopilina heterotoma]XP_043480901.1 dehydrodolichyl diphosphate synthase complex subunit nus1 [Leptopilina heterotoma]
MQVIFRLLLAVIHVLYEFIYWSRHQWKLCIELLFSNRNPTVENDVLIELIKRVTKLPRHMVVILGHEEVSFQDLVKIISWCVIAGIPCVSFYDHNGFLQRSEKVIKKKLLVENSDLEQNIVWNSHSSVKPIKNGTNGTKHKTRVQLLSYDDGKGKIVSLVQELAKGVTSGELQPDEISVQLLTDKLQFDDIPNPDLAIVCGRVLSTYGCLPWHIKTTEFIQIQSHHRITVKDFALLLRKYSKCEQRYGK